MGFRPQKTVYNLHFEDPALAELEIKVTACSVDEFNAIMGGADATGQEAIEGTHKLLAKFAENIVSWNLENDDGSAMPITAETLGGLEQPFVIRLISAWQAAMVTVPNLSRRASGSGAPSEELSLGLANGSVSQPSWPQ
jgi:hypothetical protein